MILIHTLLEHVRQPAPITMGGSSSVEDIFILILLTRLMNMYRRRMTLHLLAVDPETYTLS